MEQLHFITKLLDIKDPNIQILDIINKDTHKEIIAKLDYDARTQGKMVLRYSS
ncbi:transposase [Streptococcus pneumoniae]|nr:transposase [Streptococcus pneumoniae]